MGSFHVLNKSMQKSGNGLDSFGDIDFFFPNHFSLTENFVSLYHKTPLLLLLHIIIHHS